MDDNLGISSNNARLAVLKRWLAKPPPRATMLRLIAVADGTQLKLGQWLRDELVPGLAHEIDALADDHARESGLAEMRFLLAFVDDSDGALLTKPFTVRRVTEETASAVALGIDGTAQGFNVQMQRTMEAMMRMFMTGMQTQQRCQLELVTLLSDKLVDSHQRVDDARDVANELRQLVAEGLAGAESDNDGPPSEQKERLFKLLADNLPLILAKMAS